MLPVYLQKIIPHAGVRCASSMAEQAASLADTQIKALMTSDQCLGGLESPEGEPWRTRALSPFLDYLLTEGNEDLEPLVTRDTEYRSSYNKVMRLFGDCFIALHRRIRSTIGARARMPTGQWNNPNPCLACR